MPKMQKKISDLNIFKFSTLIGATINSTTVYQVNNQQGWAEENGLRKRK